MPALLLAVACGGEESPDGPAGAKAAGMASAPATPTTERVADPEVAALREHLDLGRIDAAHELLAEWGPKLGVEGHLLAARLHALAGQDADSVRAIERARAADPDDPRVSATMVELSAAAGRIDTAFQELERGFETVGRRAELVRAKGVLELCTSGGAKRGIASIESALRLDPSLPFTDRALAQGHLLLAKQALGEGRPSAALESVRTSLSYDPEEVEARRVLADALASTARLEEAVAVLAELVEAGEPLGGELALMHKKAGIAALIPIPEESDADRAARRERALDHLVRARELGLTDEELKSGARILAEEGARAREAGVDAYLAGDRETARDRFRRALRFDREDVAARNHLAIALFQLGEPAQAADHFRTVMIELEGDGIVPPEPVHLNLARALVESGDVAGARGTLERWLDRNADDEAYADWVERTREVLARL